MIPKFRFYASEEFIGMYNVIEIRFDEETIVIEDDKNTSMIEVVDGDFHTSKNGYPTYCYEFSEGVLMQSTGQFDMDGKEIYEGDIVSYFIGGMNFEASGEGDFAVIDYDAPFSGYHINEIVFSGGSFGVKASDTTYPIWGSERNIKVMGNKFENTDLI